MKIKKASSVHRECTWHARIQTSSMHRSKHKNRDDNIFYYIFITKKMSLDWHSIEIRYIQSFAFDSWICWLNFHHGHSHSIGHDQMCQCLVGTRLLKLFQRLCDYFPSVKHEAIPWEHFVTDSRFFFRCLGVLHSNFK